MHSVVSSMFIVVETSVRLSISIVRVIGWISIALRYDVAITISSPFAVPAISTSNVRLKMVVVSLIKVR
jgi:hypothetical protein